MELINRLCDDYISLPDAITTSYASLALVISFFAITWAFTQIIFPKLKKLDSIREDLLDRNLPLADIGRDMDGYESKLNEAASEIESQLLKYEITYKSGIYLTIKVSLLFIIVTAIVVFVSSQNNIVLVALYLLFVMIMTLFILRAYPSPNKMRSFEYLTNSLGYNPYALWGMMQAGFFLDSSMAEYNTGKYTDKIHFILKQELYVTGWNYYLEVGSKLRNKTYLVTTGSVSLSRSTIRSFSEYGVRHYLDMGSIHHADCEIPLRKGLRELKTTMLIITPVFKGSIFKPFYLEQYNDIRQEVVGYGSTGPELSARHLQEDHAVAIRAKRHGYKIDVKDREITHIRKNIFKKISKLIEKNKTCALADAGGDMDSKLKDRKAKIIFLSTYYLPGFVIKRLF